VACIRWKRNAFSIFEGNLKYREDVEHLGVDVRIILK
jgi:hypothetical protein